MEKLYNCLNEYYQKKFKERVLKIPIDGGFTCPNRDGSKGLEGCIFCSSRGAGDRLKAIPINQQIANYFASFKKDKANKFIAYFQNFTNTYAPIEILKNRYDEALFDKRIIGLAIATRADAINEEICQLLASYKEKYFVQVELGLQTSNANHRKLLNQNVSDEDFIKAINLLNKYDIEIVIHIMVGLPYENHDDIKNTVQFLNKINYNGLKIHSTYIEKDTVLSKMYEMGLFKPIALEDYLEELIYILTHIKKDVIIHRLTGDPYLANLVAPTWMLHKKLILNNIEKILEIRHLKQGCFFN